MRIFDFPVSLRHMNVDGVDVPKARAVFNEDTKQPICAVSDQYTLVPHSAVMDKAEEFFHKIGTPEIKYTMGDRGKNITAEVFFRDRTFEVAKNDLVGLKVFVRNSYDTSSAVKVQIGALRLVCLNGMVASRENFSFSHKHKGIVDIQLPDAEYVLESIATKSKQWASLTHADITHGDIDELRFQLKEQSIFGERADEKLAKMFGNYDSMDRKPITAWDAYNNVTYILNHESNKLSQIGKMNKLEKVDRYFQQVYA